MNRYLVLNLLLLICFRLSGQTSGMHGLSCDSVQQRLNYIFARDLTEKPASREIAPSLLEFTRQKNCESLPDAMNLMAVICYDKGDLITAKRLLLGVDSMLTGKSILTRTYIRSQLYLGLIALREFNYESAKLYFDISIRLSRRVDFKKGELQACLNLGLVYIEQGALEDAEKYLLQAISLRESLENQLLIGYAYFNLGRIRRMQQQPGQALEYLAKAEQIWQDPPFPKGLCYNNTLIADIAADQDNTEKRIRYLKKAVAYAEQDSSIIPYFSYFELGYYYLSNGRPEAAINYFQKTLQSGENLPDDALINMVSDLLDLYAAGWDLDGIRQVNSRLLEIYGKKAESAKIEAKKWRDKEIRLENQTVQLERRNRLLLMLALLSVAVLYIAFSKYRESKVRKKLLEEIELQHRIVQEKNQAILETQDKLIVQEKLASLGNLTAGISHEIKNPLNFISNFAEDSGELTTEIIDQIAGIKDQIPSGAYNDLQVLLQDLKNNAALIQENGLRINNIVRTMMDHARGRGADRQAVNLKELLNENANLAYHSFRANDPGFHVIIHKDYEPGLPIINGLPQQLGRVILNILTNACDAVNQKRKETGDNYQPAIHLSATASSDRVAICIRDNGPGIPEAIRKEIFTPFFTTKPPGLGNTGLGLSISYDIIVKNHLGELIVNSETGLYTEFIIRLPINHPEPADSNED